MKKTKSLLEDGKVAWILFWWLLALCRWAEGNAWDEVIKSAPRQVGIAGG